MLDHVIRLIVAQAVLQDEGAIPFQRHVLKIVELFPHGAERFARVPHAEAGILIAVVLDVGAHLRRFHAQIIVHIHIIHRIHHAQVKGQNLIVFRVVRDEIVVINIRQQAQHLPGLDVVLHHVLAAVDPVFRRHLHAVHIADAPVVKRGAERQTLGKFLRRHIVCAAPDDLLQNLVRKDLRSVKPCLVRVLPLGRLFIIQFDDLCRLIASVDVRAQRISRQIHRRRKRQQVFIPHLMPYRPLDRSRVDVPLVDVQSVPQSPQGAAKQQHFEHLLDEVHRCNHFAVPPCAVSRRLFIRSRWLCRLCAR